VFGDDLPFRTYERNGKAIRQLNGSTASVPANESRERFDTREVVAPAVGMSTATYSRAKQLAH